MQGSPQCLICLVFFGEIRAKARVEFLSVSLHKRQITSEASAAVSYHEKVKIAVSRVKRQILGCWGMCLLFTAAEGRLLRSESSIAAYVRQRRLLYGFVAQFCFYTAVE